MKTEIFAGFTCHQVGKIESINPAGPVATVSLLIQRVVFNLEQGIGAGLQLTPTIVDYPVLVDVPVFVLSGGGAVITCPVESGDDCLVLFNDRDIDNWFATGAPAQPLTARMHHLSDGLALVGWRSEAQPDHDLADGRGDQKQRRPDLGRGQDRDRERLNGLENGDGSTSSQP